MLLSELAEKELIQVEDGVRFGLLTETEMLFDPKSGAIIGFEVLKKNSRFSFQSRPAHSNEYIPWEEIVLIGDDRILFNKTKMIDSEMYK